MGRRILLIFDEASGIIDRVWEVAEGALTDEGTEIVWCAFGNPTQPSGRFFECFNRQRDRWSGRQVDSRTVDGTNKALFEQWAETYGEDSDFMRVRVKGKFPRAGSMQFIGTDTVAEATRREVSAIITDAVFIDGGGVGAGVVDRANYDTNAERYANKRAEMWGTMRTWLQTGGIPDDQTLLTDLSGPWYFFNPRNEIVLERKEDMKKRGLASPDMADALALTFAYPVLKSHQAGGPWGGRPQQKDYDPWTA